MVYAFAADCGTAGEGMQEQVIQIIAAGPADEVAVLGMMRKLYAHEHMNLNGHVRKALAKVLADKSLGQVWLVQMGKELAGYAVVTRLYSLEYGGACGLLDELYICPENRGKGVGKGVLDLVVRQCQMMGMAAVHLEVGHGNDAAARIYERAGFAKKDRHFMTLWLKKIKGKHGGKIDDSRYSETL